MLIFENSAPLRCSPQGATVGLGDVAMWPACANGNRLGALHHLRSGSRMKSRWSRADENAMPHMPEAQITTMLPAHAFVHVPMLAGKIREPEKSMYRIYSRDRAR